MPAEAPPPVAPPVPAEGALPVSASAPAPPPPDWEAAPAVPLPVSAGFVTGADPPVEVCPKAQSQTLHSLPLVEQTLVPEQSPSPRHGWMSPGLHSTTHSASESPSVALHPVKNTKPQAHAHSRLMIYIQYHEHRGPGTPSSSRWAPEPSGLSRPRLP